MYYTVHPFKVYIGFFFLSYSQGCTTVATVLSSSCPLCHFSLCPQALDKNWWIFLSTDLPIWDIYFKWNQTVLQLSVSIMFSEFIHVVVCISTSNCQTPFHHIDKCHISLFLYHLMVIMVFPTFQLLVMIPLREHISFVGICFIIFSWV